MSSRHPSPVRQVTGALSVCSTELGFTLSPGRLGHDSRAPGLDRWGEKQPHRTACASRFSCQFPEAWDHPLVRERQEPRGSCCPGQGVGDQKLGQQRLA